MTRATLNRRAFLGEVTAGCAALWAAPRGSWAEASSATRPNVLFVAVDDLRPLLACYGAPGLHTPHIDALARQGLVFERAYCQNAVCSPSRTSVLTGLRPDSTRIFDNATHFRRYAPDVVTLPQHFKEQGYHTEAIGKIYHSCFENAYVGRTLDDAPSWSVPSWFPPPQYYHTPEGMQTAREVFARQPHCGLEEGRMCIHTRHQEFSPGDGQDRSAAVLDRWREHFVLGPISEAPDVEDDVLYDGQVGARAVASLRSMGAQPWFLAVGFMKPHTPYVAPKRYWDLYQREDFIPAEASGIPEGAPALALLPQHDHAPYSGVPESGPLSDDEARHLAHGYAACVSFIDAQVGRMLRALEDTGQRENTIIVFWGDHGYHLGEQSRWGKQTCYETATRVPLVVQAPGMRAPGQQTRALVELVDLYPSLCELAGLPLPAHLEGDSFAPLLNTPDLAWKPAAFSQFPRPVRLSVPEHPPQPGDCMGYSMRTERYRFTVWQEILSPEKHAGIELYDYAEDALETRNLAVDPGQAALVARLHQDLKRGWRHARVPRPNGRTVAVP